MKDRQKTGREVKRGNERKIYINKCEKRKPGKECPISVIAKI